MPTIIVDQKANNVRITLTAEEIKQFETRIKNEDSKPFASPLFKLHPTIDPNHPTLTRDDQRKYFPNKEKSICYYSESWSAGPTQLYVIFHDLIEAGLLTPEASKKYIEQIATDFCRKTYQPQYQAQIIQENMDRFNAYVLGEAAAAKTVAQYFEDEYIKPQGEYNISLDPSGFFQNFAQKLRNIEQLKPKESKKEKSSPPKALLSPLAQSRQKMMSPASPSPAPEIESPKNRITPF